MISFNFCMIMLLLNSIEIIENLIIKSKKSGSSRMGQDHQARSPWTGCSQFLPTTQKIIQFSDGKPPKSSDKIVSVNVNYLN